LGAYSGLLEKIVAEARLYAYTSPLLARLGATLYTTVATEALEALVAGATPAPSPTAGRVAGGEAPVYSTTNIQVAGVDEQDVVKTNGRLIVVARDRDVVVVDAREKKVVGYVNASGVKGLYLVNDTLVAIRAEQPVVVFRVGAATAPSPTKYPSLVEVLVYDLSEPSRPSLLARLNFTGVFAGSRLVGKNLYVVGYMDSYVYEAGVNAITPLIPLVNGGFLAREDIVEAGNYASYVIVAALDVASGDYVVRAFTGGVVEWIYMVPDRLYVAWSGQPPHYRGFFELAEYLASRGVIPVSRVREYEEAISRGDVLWVLEDLENALRNYPQLVKELSGKPIEGAGFTDETVFLVLDVRGLEVSERGVFKVPGSLLDQFAVEEFYSERGRFLAVATTVNEYAVYAYGVSECPVTQGQALRVVVVEEGAGYSSTKSVELAATTPQAACEPGLYWGVLPAESSNSVYVVDSDLRVVSRLEGLAQGERVYAARLLKNTLYLVTFRQVDPLFAIDLSDPYSPRVLGYLKAPGFSEYLHPVSEGVLIGVGSEEGKLKVSLFDISDPASPREAAKLKVEEYSWSEAFVDHHAFTIDPRHGLLAIPVRIAGAWEGFLVAEYSVDNMAVRLRALVGLESPMRALYIGSEMYFAGYSKTLIYGLPGLEPVGSVEY